MTTTVEVALPIRARRTFTYRVAPELAGRAVPGARAVVPLGRARSVGLIVATGNGAPESPGAEQPAATALRSVLELPDDAPLLGAELLELTRWAADYYLCSWGEMLRAALPGGLSLRPVERLRLTPEGARVAESLLPGAAQGRNAALKALNRAGARGLARGSLLNRLGAGGAAVLERLVGSGLAASDEEPGRAPPLRGRPPVAEPPPAGEFSPAVPPAPTVAQEEALERILAASRQSAPRPLLLHGVTGSGKTEVYLRAISACLRDGRGALYLVPEIGLTPLLLRQIRSRFGGQVALLHSGLAAGERRSEWQRLVSGEAMVALGPRSAVFAPVRRPGLIVIDEEQDGAYKQEESPRYHARDLALVRARLCGAVAVLGTATPSLETWRNVKRGKYDLVRLPERIGGRPLPRVELVNLREEFRETGEIRVLSRRLVEALVARLARGEQAVVLINRRGYAPFLLCRACGETVRCRRCSVSLVLHASDGALRCHTCGARRRRPALCPSCLSEHLQPVGEGTERAERHLHRALPGARIVRMDSDSVRGRRAAERILAAFERKEHDVLVGTQMVAKGHDFPEVTLVGVLLADGMLGMPDFRAGERTYQLLTQVAGRAGRGGVPGEVIVQALRPDHLAIRAVAEGDEAAFYDREMRVRRALRYPPFTVFTQVLARASKPDRATDAAGRAAEAVRRLGAGRVEVLGPAPAPIHRARGQYRVQLIARAASRRRLGAAVSGMLEEAERGGWARLLTVDVDPLSLL